MAFSVLENPSAESLAELISDGCRRSDLFLQQSVRDWFAFGLLMVVGNSLHDLRKFSCSHYTRFVRERNKINDLFLAAYIVIEVTCSHLTQCINSLMCLD